KNPSPGFYAAQQKAMNVTDGIVRQAKKPVLLHEYMHAYHHQCLTGGLKNQDVLTYYKRAKSLQCYASNSHMMQNSSEFFACGATAYLFGVTAQEPFKREKIQSNQPLYFDYLKELFSSQAGKYVGSLQ